MMPGSNLVRMVIANTLRSPRHFILSAFGIVIGIGAFVLFLALTQRAGQVLEKVFPLDEVQVVAPTVSLAGVDTSKRLDENTVHKILARPGVTDAVPRMNIGFPAAGHGSFEGKDFNLELGGFVDGVNPGFVQDDERIKDLFRDWDAIKDDPNRLACVPPPQDPDNAVTESPRGPPRRGPKKSTGWGDVPPPESKVASTPGVPPPIPAEFKLPPPGVPLSPWPVEPVAPPEPAVSPAAGSAAPVGGTVASAVGSAAPAAGSAAPVAVSVASAAGSAAPVAGSPAPAAGSATIVRQTGTPTKPPYTNPCPNPDRYYCDDTERVCKHRVPIVLSSTVVELYNTRFAKANGMPVADQDLVKFLIASRGLSAMRFSVGLNNSIMGGSGKVSRKAPRRVEAVIVGVSNRAMQLGVTVPISYIERWNREYMGDEVATAYSSIIVKLQDRNQIAPFSQWLKDTEDLRLEDSHGEQLATVIFVIRILFLIISVAILVVAIINIGHNFFVQVTERRREIGIMRAVGATQADVLLIVLGEAAMVGIVGGIIGIGLAIGLGAAWDAIAAAKIPRFPFKPASWFEFKTWIWASALGFSTVFCILGGYLPARRAAKMEPAQALAQN
jgi:hypothetical protein